MKRGLRTPPSPCSDFINENDLLDTVLIGDVTYTNYTMKIKRNRKTSAS